MSYSLNPPIITVETDVEFDDMLPKTLTQEPQRLEGWLSSGFSDGACCDDYYMEEKQAA